MDTNIVDGLAERLRELVTRKSETAKVTKELDEQIKPIKEQIETMLIEADKRDYISPFGLIYLKRVQYPAKPQTPEDWELLHNYAREHGYGHEIQLSSAAIKKMVEEVEENVAKGGPRISIPGVGEGLVKIEVHLTKK